MMKKQSYRFLYRADDVVVMATLPITSGSADRCAKATAKEIAKAGGYGEVYLIWQGPAEMGIPEEIMDQLRRERAS